MEILRKWRSPERREYRAARREYRRARKRDDAEQLLDLASTEGGLILTGLGLLGLAANEGNVIGSISVIAGTLAVGALGLRTYIDIGNHLDNTQELRQENARQAFRRYSDARKALGKTF